VETLFTLFLWLHHKRAVTGTLRALCDDLVIKNILKYVYMLPCGRKMCVISIKGFAFLYVKVNSKEICEEILYHFLLLLEIADFSIFIRRSRLIILGKCATTPSFLFGFQYPLLKIYFFHMVLISPFPLQLSWSSLSKQNSCSRNHIGYGG